MDENFHDIILVAYRYIFEDENPHCIPCYQELYANCEECKKPIGPDYKVNEELMKSYCVELEGTLESSLESGKEDEEDEEERYFDACLYEEISHENENDKFLQNEVVKNVEQERERDGNSQKSEAAENIALNKKEGTPEWRSEEEDLRNLIRSIDEEEEEEHYFDACSSEDMSKKKEQQNELVNGVELEPKNGKSQKSKAADNITLLEEENGLGEMYRILSDARRKVDGVFKGIPLDFEPILFHRVSPFSSARLIKSSFALCCLHLPCAGGFGLEYGQDKQKTLPDIYEHTLNPVSHCPNASEYKLRASSKCDDVCGNYIQNRSCSYHCMRDSYKTSLVEFCAKSKILFDYCPEYDPIGRTIQKDVSTLCNSSDSIKKFYKSSDIFFCDPNSCLQLQKVSASTFVTGMVMSTTTPISKDIKKTGFQQYLLWLILFPGIPFLYFVAYIYTFIKKRQSEDKKEKHEIKKLMPPPYQLENPLLSIKFGF